MYTLKYKTEISCSHQLPNAYNEKCHNIHGHTYKILIKATTQELKNDVVLDFKLLKDVVDELDHRHLNDFLEVPTAERLAEYLVERIKVASKDYNKDVKIEITVFESDKSSITFTDDEN